MRQRGSVFASRVCLFLLLVSSLVLGSCGVETTIDLEAKDLAIDEPLPLPENWEEVYRGTDYQEHNVTSSWLQNWEPRDSDNQFIGLSVCIDKFNTVKLARRGYKQTLHRFYDMGFRMEPLPEWSYVSNGADRYAMYCSWPETTGEYCYSVGQYANFVVVIALKPGEGVTLEDTPPLFEAIDQHIQMVITQETQ